MILYGAPVREQIKVLLKEKIAGLKRAPVLAIVQVGERPDSNLYIKNKIKFGEEIGAKVSLYKFLEQITQEELEGEIGKLAMDKTIDGIIVQLPLPTSFDSEKILSLLPKEKDADGLATSKVVPATARAVTSLLDYYGIKIEGKKVAVIGRSKLAGGPIAEELTSRGALVTVCHRGTLNMEQICKGSDILISAAGQPGLVTKDFVNKNQVVVDVGINKTTSPPTPLLAKERGEETNNSVEKPKFVGDVVFDEVEPIVKAITPVPGGIGPLTVACLFLNLLDLC